MQKDPLTHLADRETFLALADHQMKQARRDRKIFCLLQVTATGDRDVQVVADVLKRSIREADCLAYVGDYQFFISALLKEKGESKQIIRRIEHAFSQYRARNANSKAVQLSFSAAYAYHEDEATLWSLLEQLERGK